MMQPGHELPYMSEEELTNFIAVNPELDLCDEEVEYLHLRRRRLSLRMRPPPTQPPDDSYRVVVVGEPSVAAAQQCAQLFLLGPACAGDADIVSVSRRVPCYVGRRTLHSTAEGLPPHGAHDINVFAPPSGEKDRFLRGLLYGSASAVVLVFSVTNRRSFDRIRDHWIPEVRAACADSQMMPALMVVGADAEQRRRQSGDDFVDSSEAVAISQELGVAKYMEVFSGNVAHSVEVFSQVAEAIGAQLARATPAAVSARRQQQVLDDTAFGELLRCPPPALTVDTFNRVLVLDPPHPRHSDSVVTYSVDGTDPTPASPVLEGALRLCRAFPHTVRLRRWARCRVPSDVAVFTVPPEAPKPDGFFDVVRKTFCVRVPPTHGFRYHYTTDGSRPAQSSPVLRELLGTPVLNLDSGAPLQALERPEGSLQLPEAICVVAVSDDHLRSRTARFPLPPVLGQPVLHCSDDGALKVLSPDPAAEYRYTLDGSAPRIDSQLLTGTAMLPRGRAATRVRVAAFPRVSLPSCEAELIVPAGQALVRERSPTQPASVQMTRASSARAAHVQQQHRPQHRPSSARPSSPANSARQRGTGRTASPPTTPRSSGAPRPTLSPARPSAASPRTRPPAAEQKRSVAPPRQPSGRSAPEAAARALSRPPPHGRTATPPKERHSVPPPPPPPPPQTTTPQQQASCSASENSVDFDFPRPIQVSHATVSTPGKGLGPCGYSIEVMAEGSDSFVHAGSGELADEERLQIMDVSPLCRVVRAVRVRCSFHTSGTGPFQIHDMKIHGKSA